MSSLRKHARFVVMAAAVAIALPIALTIVAETGTASGYVVASGRTGFICNPGGDDDCPDGGQG